MYQIILFFACIVNHATVLALLSLRRWHLSQPSSNPRAQPIPSTWIKRQGSIVALFTLALPYTCLELEPLNQCAVRVACFFYAFKLLDLALTKSDTPPKLLDTGERNERPRLLQISRYIWLLLTEMRYHAFDTEVIQKARPANNAGEGWRDRLLPPLITSTLAYTYPVAETKCLLLLCVIQNGLEGVHTLFHFKCPHKLFYKPFAAATLGDFWTLHWHASAVLLQSLAYKPGRRLGGRGLGVLAAFALSGLWHGWAAMPLVGEEYAVKLCLQVCTFFVMLGVGSLLERVVWQDKQGGLLQRVLVWTWALLWAGWCFRTLECHSRVAFLRTEHCSSASTSEQRRWT